ncbi:MAG: hypothetical protein OWU32_07050 [Firmicutes bacterium]|nr:hypothetical protein [Bacillota bacterium]
MLVIELVVLAVILAGLAFSARKRGNGGLGGGAEVVAALEEFADKMEEENNQLIEMISMLRQKLDAQELEAQNSATMFTDQARHIEEHVAHLEQRFNVLMAPPVLVDPRLPDYLSPRYRAAAERLLRGDDTLQIMREMDMGQGELELVARLLESESEHS